MSGSIAQQFDVFARLVATGNVAECARSLNLPAASVLDTMSSLEALMGCQIFVATAGSLELTADGRRVVDALGEMAIDGQEEWTRALGGLNGAPSPADLPPEPEIATPEIETVAFEPVAETIAGDAPVTPKHFRPYRPEEARAAMATAPATSQERVQQRTITLASHPAIFSHFQEALLAFEEASPDIGIELMLESIDEDEAARLFHEGKADIAYYYALAESHTFPSRYAWSERISLFVGAGHPLAGEEALGAREIAALPYAALGPGNMARTLAEEALADSGLAMPYPELETDDLYRIMSHLQQSDACFAAFGPVARDFGRMRGIERLAYASGLPQVQVRQAIRPALAEDAAILALAEFLFR